MPSIMEKFQLPDRVALVTGASSGLGLAAAIGLAEAGADVVLAARRVDRLAEAQSAIRRIGRRAAIVRTDVSDPASCQQAAEACIEEYGRLDILVNNAGVGTAVPAIHETPDEFRKVIDVNLNGTYWMAQSSARVMRGGGSIINVSSVLALTTLGLPQAAYSASKAGVLGLTRDLAQQWTGRKGIRVNAIAPGLFRSEMTDQYTDGYVDSQAHRRLIQRYGAGDEFAAAVVFLASDAAAYITGQVLAVDGGICIT